MSILIAKYFHKKEERWLAYKKKGDAEIAAAMTLEGANRMAIEASRRRRSEHTSRRSMSARRMSERQSSDVRAGVREQLARRAATENDVSRAGADGGDAGEVDRLHQAHQDKKKKSGFNPGVPATPSEEVQALARMQSPPNRRAVSLDVARPTSS